MTQLRVGSATDVGRVRSNNEDNLLVADGLYAVADGMGGHAAGEVASLTAVEALRAAFNDERTADALAEAVKEANRAVWDRAAERQGLRGMGTTLTAVAVVEEDGDKILAVTNVGDSRAYLLRDGELGRLTDDHSLPEEMVRRGELTPEEAAVHPQKHIVTRALGIDADVEVDCFRVVPYRGDRLLLASDGLFDELNDDQIASLLRRLADPDEAARELVRAAKASGGRDNITVVVIDVVDDDDRAERASAALEDIPSPRSTGQAIATSDDDDRRTEVVPVADVTDAGDAEAAGARGRRRRATAATIGFVLALLLILGGAVAAIGFYARGMYYVGLRGQDVAIFKGRAGGLLWFEPTVEERTTLNARDVPPARVDDVRAGKEFTSRAAAERYVRRLREERASIERQRQADEQQQAPAPTTAPPPAPPAPPAPEAPPASVP